MIALEILQQGQVNEYIIRADEPVRISFFEVPGHSGALVYQGTEDDYEQDPVGVFDSTITNKDWKRGVA